MMKTILSGKGRMRVLFLLTATLVLVGCATAPTETRAPAFRQRQNAGMFDIRVATKELVGKTPRAIVRILGRPDRQFGSEHWEWWTYENKFHDSIAQRILGPVTLVFHDGKLVDITF